MRRFIVLMLGLAIVGSSIGCAAGFRRVSQPRCPSVGSANPVMDGKVSDGYTPSEYVPQGVIPGSQTYSGSPTYMVNSGMGLYSNRPCFSNPNLFGNRAAVRDGAGTVPAGYANPENFGRGGFGRGLAARNGAMGYGPEANYQLQYTPTRSPRDFLNPNPPSIGP